MLINIITGFFTLLYEKVKKSEKVGTFKIKTPQKTSKENALYFKIGINITPQIIHSCQKITIDISLCKYQLRGRLRYVKKTLHKAFYKVTSLQRCHNVGTTLPQHFYNVTF